MISRLPFTSAHKSRLTILLQTSCGLELLSTEPNLYTDAHLTPHLNAPLSLPSFCYIVSYILIHAPLVT
jgi:hypothetical protein